MVKFCPICTNIYTYVLKMDGDKKNLYYKCESCGKDDEQISSEELKEGRLFTKTNTNKLPDRSITANMCHDRSLAHTSTVPCPNPKCLTNDKKNEMYEKYDNVYFHYNTDMKMAYICCKCRVYWKID